MSHHPDRYVFHADPNRWPWPHIEDLAAGPMCVCSLHEWWVGPHHEERDAKKLMRHLHFRIFGEWPHENRPDHEIKNIDRP